MSKVFDVIIVGSGPAGTSAAQVLAGRDVLMLDVGHEPDSAGESLDSNISELKKDGKANFEDLIGKKFESLHNINHSYLSPKLKAPLMRYVTRDSEKLCPLITSGFETLMSFSRGGYANAWGAGAFRYNDDELSDFPISAAELDPHYDALSQEIGICGEEDDLTTYFGSTSHLHSPLRLAEIGSDMLRRYKKNRNFFNRRSLFLGRPRSAMISATHNGRNPYSYDGLELFKPNISSIYNPTYTLDELVSRSSLHYRKQTLVEYYVENGDSVSVFAKNLQTGSHEEFRAKHLLLAAGTINTSKIVLRSKNDFQTKLPLRDNIISYVPLLDLRRIGQAVEPEAVPNQLTIMYDGPLYRRPVLCSVFGMSSALWTDYLFDFPLSASGCSAAVKYLVPAMLTVQVFYPDDERASGTIQLDQSGALRIDYAPGERGQLEQHLISSFMRFGYFSLPSLCKYLPAGSSYHCAGTLPMREKASSPFETDKNGLLGQGKRVRVVDSANFTTLPSKNLTFTIMANSRRIAEGLQHQLQ